MLLPQIGEAGQRKLAEARVLLVGCGALGSAIAEQLVRAGVGHLAIADRDIVELTNLQRQTLYVERDAAEGTPKAVAAAERLGGINSAVEIRPEVTDVHAGNVEGLAGGVDLILDGTDNVQTRYLMNDVAVKHGIPWVYGAAVGVEGRVMAVRPGKTACLRCVFSEPPSPQELPTCDTAGVLGMGASIVGAWQAIEGIKLLVGAEMEAALMRFEFWRPRVHFTPLADAKREDCPCCGRRRFHFLDAPLSDSAVTLCGRNAVQIRPGAGVQLSLPELESRLTAVGHVERTRFLLRCKLHDPRGVTMTVFPDGRSLIQGVTDLNRAKSLHARFVGA
jgi:adenylyltransferase/sulfurtransferase